MHKCFESKFPCFDCKQMICKGCVVADKDTLRCRPCDTRIRTVAKSKAEKKKKPVPAKTPLMLGFAAFGFSFVALSALKMVAFCVT